MLLGPTIKYTNQGNLNLGTIIEIEVLSFRYILCVKEIILNLLSLPPFLLFVTFFYEYNIYI